MPVKVLDNTGSGSFFDVAEGIDYAVNFADSGGKKPVKVINMSLGGPGASETTRLAINRALAAGIVVVAASGNDNGPVSYPAAFPNVIGVGAVDFRKVRASYSNFGPEVSVVAPGGDIDRDDDNNGDADGVLQQTFDPFSAQFGIYDDFAYFYFDGTSSATPHVSAMAALLVSQGITDPVAVRKAIESTALDLGPAGRDDEYGHGLIQPAVALTGLGLNQ
jgi:serine protease